MKFKIFRFILSFVVLFTGTNLFSQNIEIKESLTLKYGPSKVYIEDTRIENSLGKGSILFDLSFNKRWHLGIDLSLSRFDKNLDNRNAFLNKKYFSWGISPVFGYEIYPLLRGKETPFSVKVLLHLGYTQMNMYMPKINDSMNKNYEKDLSKKRLHGFNFGYSLEALYHFDRYYFGCGFEYNRILFNGKINSIPFNNQSQKSSKYDLSPQIIFGINLF